MGSFVYNRDMSRAKTKEPPKKLTFEQLVNQACDLSREELQILCQQWLQANFEIELPDPETTDYAGYFDYFRRVPPAQLTVISKTANLGVEGEAALRRWLDILSHPSRMKDISAAGLKTDEKDGIVELAKQNDQLKTLEALRDQLAEQLARGVSPRDAATIAKNMTAIMDQIAEVKRRQAPTDATPLGKIIKKRTRGKGRRNVSYSSKLTIKELEGLDKKAQP